jgi:hypothetical protein
MTTAAFNRYRWIPAVAMLMLAALVLDGASVALNNKANQAPPPVQLVDPGYVDPGYTKTLGWPESRLTKYLQKSAGADRWQLVACGSPLLDSSEGVDVTFEICDGAVTMVLQKDGTSIISSMVHGPIPGSAVWAVS